MVGGQRQVLQRLPCLAGGVLSLQGRRAWLMCCQQAWSWAVYTMSGGGVPGTWLSAAATTMSRCAR